MTIRSASRGPALAKVGHAAPTSPAAAAAPMKSRLVAFVPLMSRSLYIGFCGEADRGYQEACRGALHFLQGRGAGRAHRKAASVATPPSGQKPGSGKPPFRPAFRKNLPNSD